MSFESAAPPSRPPLAGSAQDLNDDEFLELDDLLASVPEPLEPLDVVMLDGYLCGVIVQPVLIPSDDWLPFVFDAGGHRWGEAEPGPEQQRARALILRRHSALNRTIAEFGGFDPFILEPSDDAPVEGEPDAQTTSEGAAAEQALHAFPALVEMGGSAVDTTLARLFRFLPETGEESRAVAAVLARERPLASLDDAIAELVGAVAELYDLTEPLRYKVERVRRETPKVGRNDPCPCGSGKKFKQCHGAT